MGRLAAYLFGLERPASNPRMSTMADMMSIVDFDEDLKVFQRAE